MNYNDRFFILFETLKKAGRIKTYVQLAEIIGTNKAGINDIKSGRKKLTLENIKSMILSYPDINLYWFLTESGDVLDENFIAKSKSNDSNKDLIEKICELSVENADLKKNNDALIKENELLKKDKSKPYKSVQCTVSMAAEPKLK